MVVGKLLNQLKVFAVIGNVILGTFLNIKKKHKRFLFRFCGNPSDYDLDLKTNENEVLDLNYGITNFRNIFVSFWNVFQFMDLMGWTGISYPVIFWGFILNSKIKKKNKFIF